MPFALVLILIGLSYLWIAKPLQKAFQQETSDTAAQAEKNQKDSSTSLNSHHLTKAANRNRQSPNVSSSSNYNHNANQAKHRSRQPASVIDPQTFLNSRKHQGQWTSRLEVDGTETLSGGVDLLPVTNVGDAEELLHQLSTSQSDLNQWALSEEKTKVEGIHRDQVYHWDQRFDNMVVFNGYTRIFTRGEDSGVYFIVKNEQPITATSLNRNIKISASEAKIIVSKTFENVDEVDVEVDPQIFVHQDKSSELAWNLVVKYNSHERRRLLVGATTGGILYNESLVYF